MTDFAPVRVGIDDIAIATASFRIPLKDIAPRLGADPAKYEIGLGQTEMSVLGEDEDIVTMAADAVARIIERHGTEGIRTILFATETGIDQSKAAGVYVQSLVGLPENVRVVELKQACYSGTAALQFAAALVARSPHEKALVITSDIARYELDSAAEPTQGAGAVAMLVTANPSLLELDPETGVFTRDVMDFWRPNHSATARVDGKTSIGAYLDAAAGAWDDYARASGRKFAEFASVVYHQPFTAMALKAHRHLGKVTGSPLTRDELDAQIASTTTYNRRIGNSYTASMYFALAALLDSKADLSGERIGLLSYGSGSVAEFFSATVVPGYRDHLRSDENARLLDERTEVSDERYLELSRAAVSGDPNNRVNNADTARPFRFAGVLDDKRQYERTSGIEGDYARSADTSAASHSATSSAQ